MNRAILLRRVLLSILLVSSVTLAACGGGSNASTSTSSSSPSGAGGGRPTTPATLEIVKPTENEVTPSSFTAQFKLTGGSFASETSADVTPDKGFIHVSVDDRQVAIVDTTDVPLYALTPGPHTLSGEYVASDHAPFQNRAIVTVSFTVQ